MMSSSSDSHFSGSCRSPTTETAANGARPRRRSCSSRGASPVDREADDVASSWNLPLHGLGRASETAAASSSERNARATQSDRLIRSTGDIVDDDESRVPVLARRRNVPGHARGARRSRLRAPRARAPLRPPAMLPSRRRALAPLALALVLGSPPPLFASTDADACFWNAATGACQASARWLASNRLVFSDQGLFLAELVGGVETCASAFDDADACAAADHCAYYPAAGACLPDASWSLDKIRRCVLGRGSDVDPAVTAIASLASECLARSSSEDACAAHADGKCLDGPLVRRRRRVLRPDVIRVVRDVRGARARRARRRANRVRRRDQPRRVRRRDAVRVERQARGARRTPSERSACQRVDDGSRVSGSRRRVSPRRRVEDACADVGNDALGCVGTQISIHEHHRRNTAATAATEAADGGAATRATPPTSETRRRVILRTRCSRRGAPALGLGGGDGECASLQPLFELYAGCAARRTRRGATRRACAMSPAAGRWGRRASSIPPRRQTSPPVARRGPARGGQPRVRDGRGHEGSVRGGIHGRGRGGKRVQRRGRGRGRGDEEDEAIPRSARAAGTWW